MLPICISDLLTFSPDQPELLKAVGELAAENADLYRKIGDLTHALKTEQGRFGTWAKEVARDREQAAQDKAQMTERLDKVRVSTLTRRRHDVDRASFYFTCGSRPTGSRKEGPRCAKEGTRCS